MKLNIRPPLALLAASVVSGATAAKQPNILFILTDDQDWHMNSMEHMPFLQKYLLNEGTLYANHYCTVAICCPSRVNLWTGKAAHNTNVTDVWAPYGGWPKVVAQGINDDYLPHWLQAAGYNTYYAGKLWNHHTTTNFRKPLAGGFNSSDFLLDPHTYQYFNATMTRNGGDPVNYKDQYSPDVTAHKMYGFMDEAIASSDGRPWFVVHAPIAPHGRVDLTPKFLADMPGYADRHAHLFKDYKIPRGKSFNPDVQGGVGWIKGLPKLNDTVIDYLDEYQRARLRSLQSVDEMVQKAVEKLEAAGQLENTYIFYTTDNGYHLAQHRMQPGKECGFDTDVHIPMIVRGPGIPAGHVSTAVTSHTDIASTIMELAGKPLLESDGTPLPLTRESEAKSRIEHATVEFWGLAIPEGIYGKYGDEKTSKGAFDTPGRAAGNNTYKGIRVISADYNVYYSVWCTNEHEFYDLKSDPEEMRNLLSEDHSSAFYQLGGRPLSEIVKRLDALMMVLKSCKGSVCTQPWRELHPDGDVDSLIDSLQHRFDTFYHGQPKVSFSECRRGYFPEVEGPMSIIQFGVTPDIVSNWEHIELKRETAPDGIYRGPISVWT